MFSSIWYCDIQACYLAGACDPAAEKNATAQKRTIFGKIGSQERSYSIFLSLYAAISLILHIVIAGNGIRF